MSLKKIFILLSFFYFAITSNAQNFEWLKGYGSTKGDDYNAGICSEPDGGCTILIARSGRVISNPDTIAFDSILFLTPISLEKSVYLVRLDSNGKTVKARYIGNFTTADGSFSYYLAGNGLHRDNDGNYYLSGYLSTTKLLLVGNDTLDGNKNGTLMFAKFDNNFDLKWVKQTGGSNKTKNLGINYSNGHLYFRCNSDTGAIKIGNKTFNLTPNHSFLFGEINLTDGRIKWSNYFGNKGNLSISSLLNLNETLYLSAFNPGYGYKIGSDSFPKWAGFVIETDTLGNYIKRFEFHNQNQIEVSCITSDGKNIYIGGQFKDSLNWGNNIILPEYKNFSSGILASELYAACVSKDLQPLWFFHPKIIDKTKPSGLIFTAVASNNFIYYGGWLTTKIQIGDNTLAPGSAFAGDALIFKTDLFGNILWAVNGGITTEAEMQALSAGKGIFGGGVYRAGTLSLGPHSIPSKGNLYDAFITKISDNAIFRGEVNAGPYCAGDSILIPYTKVGGYDTANVFIAQLSNEYGNFDSAYHELGRLKSNKEGTITGKLPLFKVASSNLYRIRIMSTNPAVQSYYKVDTLRLLIYSKDKANPGIDVTICKGDTTLLKTYGGTKWKWSPGYNMADSTSNATLAWPDKTTRYKIIIADSSGCGQADTAYKTVFVRKKLTAKMVPLDTIVCVGSSIKLAAAFSGGDSLNYNWQWFSIDKNGAFTELQTGSKKLVDTLNFTMPLNEKDSQKIILFLDDGCSHQTAFATYTLYINKQKAMVDLIAKDTTVCPGKVVGIVAKFNNGLTSGYNWQWYENNSSGFWLPGLKGKNKTADTLLYTLPPNAPKNKKLRIILNDKCSAHSDTAEIKITSRDTLQLGLNTRDTTFCKGSKHIFKANGKGGYSPAYQFTWTNASNGVVLSTADSFIFVADSSIRINLSLTDNCMPKTIVTAFTISVRPALKLSVSGMGAMDTTLCYGQSLSLLAKGNGGKDSGYLYDWKIDNVLISQNDTLNFSTTKHFSKNGGTQKLIISLNDNCTVPNDSAVFNITTRPALSIATTYPDSICFPNKAVFKAKAGGGLKTAYTYNWFNPNYTLLGNADSIIFDYNNASQSGTVKMIVTVADDCSIPDTAMVIAECLKPLSVKLTASDTCPTLSTILNANSQGGKPAAYQFSWWKENINSGTTNTASKTVTPTSPSTLYKVLLNDACSNASDTAFIRIGLRPSLNLSVKGFCFGDTTVGKVGSSQMVIGNQFSWQINTNAVSNTDSILKIVLPAAGQYQIRVSTDITQQCITRDTVDFSILDKPKADFSYTHIKNNNGPAFQFNDQSTGANTWFWQFGKSGNANIQNPAHTFSDTGSVKIKLRVSNQNTCFDSIEKILTVFNGIRFFFPSAFSPDGNGTNDDFGLNPNQYYLVSAFHLEIFNRWGEKVFVTDDAKEHWMGLVSAPLNEQKPQQGVYMFRVLITDIFDMSQEITGAVEVLR